MVEWAAEVARDWLVRYLVPAAVVGAIRRPSVMRLGHDTLSPTRHADQRRVAADLRIELGPLGHILVSHQAAETPDQATRLTVEDVERNWDGGRLSNVETPRSGCQVAENPRRLRPRPRR
jgi:hypothetical protein